MLYYSEQYVLKYRDSSVHDINSFHSSGKHSHIHFGVRRRWPWAYLPPRESLEARTKFCQMLLFPKVSVNQDTSIPRITSGLQLLTFLEQKVVSFLFH